MIFDKVVVFTGGVETQEYFTLQMVPEMKRHGLEVFIFDYEHEAACAKALPGFLKGSSAVMITFNFHGICEETVLRDENNCYIWEYYNVPCFNIVVDHPFYYHRFMYQVPPLYCQISIDRNHEDYLRRFYPEVKRGCFLPLGGTALTDAVKPVKDRKYDIIITGSWAEPEFWGNYMKTEGPEYEAFYRSVLKEQLDNPDRTFEEIFEKRIKAESEEGDAVTDEMLKLTYPHLIYFDMYVRYYFRGEVIRQLADAGFKVRCVGGGWDKLPCAHPENISCREYSSSEECLREIADSKISVNVMPWFKRGAHDRIFNSMLNGAVCLTDSSEYLDEILTDGKNCLIYDLKALDRLPSMVEGLLNDEDRLQRIADAGRAMAQNHTWDVRCRELLDFINGFKP